ncbi:hypothetical protein LQ564_17055 [Massilia sp. G4R7]|uniref:DUF1090 domain-containing protein n=1 Tax=Massilia phyllostachyos TaxID=2898585 RepID=A0ABS8Q8D4_9BURK|nr:hypothetical protein [Massilia phyllostachyos]MCD2518021.1 hypothetical protein [Massilia phyllostachyos]
MHSLFKTTLVVFCASLGYASAAESRLPTDVAKYVNQREGCDHFRGEFPDPPDKQRMKEVEREIRKLCTGTDKKLAQLKRKYAKNQAVLQRLSEFEEDIEAPPSTSKP